MLNNGKVQGVCQDNSYSKQIWQFCHGQIYILYYHNIQSILVGFQDKIRFTAHTGDKNVEENLAYLPSMILNITDGVPSIAQWNYRILCHPIKQDLKLKDLKPVDDLGVRLANKDLWEDYVMSRAARFSLNPFGGEKIHKWTPLDKIMKQIPGEKSFTATMLSKNHGYPVRFTALGRHP